MFLVALILKVRQQPELMTPVCQWLWRSTAVSRQRILLSALIFRAFCEEALLHLNHCRLA